MRERVWALLQRVRSDPANGVESLWTRADLDRLGAHPGRVVRHRDEVRLHHQPRRSTDC